MKEEYGNIWDKHKEGNWIVITTNGVVDREGCNVMGKGIALQAKKRFPLLPEQLGARIKQAGNIPFIFPEYRIITLPVKEHWRQPADLFLIKMGIVELAEFGNEFQSPIYLVRPGCGSGQLQWSEVKPILEKYLNDNFTVVELAR